MNPYAVFFHKPNQCMSFQGQGHANAMKAVQARGFIVDFLEKYFLIKLLVEFSPN